MQTSPPLFFSETLAGKRARRYPGGQILVYRGDIPLEVFILKSGVVKIYDIDEQGNEKILQLMSPWAVLPLTFFSGEEEPTRWFYAALTECEIYAMPVSELSARMESDSALSAYLVNWFSREMHELLIRLSSLGKTTARDKMIAALRFLAVYHAKTGPSRSRSAWLRIAFPVNHQLLANMTGITRESAASTMKSLQAEQISRNPRQTILEVNTRKL